MNSYLKVAIPAVIILVLTAQMIHLNMEIRGLQKDVGRLKDQQKQYTQVIWDEYGNDIYAAIRYFRETRPDLVQKLGNATLTVDGIVTWSFSASYNPKERVFWISYDHLSEAKKDIVYVKLVAYYPNGTQVRDLPWYVVNHTTGEVIGVASTTAQLTVMKAYNRVYRDNLTALLGIPSNESTVACGHRVALIPNNGSWFEIERYCVSFKNFSQCWFVIGEVDKKTGALKRLEITKPFEGDCRQKEDELRTRDLLEELIPPNSTVSEIRENILNVTGGLMLNLTFPNP